MWPLLVSTRLHVTFSCCVKHSSAGSLPIRTVALGFGRPGAAQPHLQALARRQEGRLGLYSAYCEPRLRAPSLCEKLGVVAHARSSGAGKAEARGSLELAHPTGLTLNGEFQARALLSKARWTDTGVASDADFWPPQAGIHVHTHTSTHINTRVRTGLNAIGLEKALI